MTCLINRALNGAGMKLHSSMLGMFYVYTLTLSMLIFKKKTSQIFLGESSKLCIVVTCKYSTRLSIFLYSLMLKIAKTIVLFWRISKCSNLNAPVMPSADKLINWAYFRALFWLCFCVGK